MIQAKFKCTEIKFTEYSESILLSPVYSNDKKDPNYSWSQATPSGKIELSVTNKAVKFEVGAEYLINFEKVVAKVPEKV
jgi:hypothetical protein